jgi:hypothetical protein
LFAGVQRSGSLRIEDHLKKIAAVTRRNIEDEYFTVGLGQQATTAANRGGSQRRPPMTRSRSETKRRWR